MAPATASAAVVPQKAHTLPRRTSVSFQTQLSVSRPQPVLLPSSARWPVWCAAYRGNLARWAQRQSIMYRRNDQLLHCFQILTCLTLGLFNAYDGPYYDSSINMDPSLSIQGIVSALALAGLSFRRFDKHRLPIVVSYLVVNMLSGITAAFLYLVYCNQWQMKVNICQRFGAMNSTCPEYSKMSQSIRWAWRCSVFMICQGLCVHPEVSHVLELLRMRGRANRAKVTGAIEELHTITKATLGNINTITAASLATNSNASGKLMTPIKSGIL